MPKRRMPVAWRVSAPELAIFVHLDGQGESVGPCAHSQAVDGPGSATPHIDLLPQISARSAGARISPNAHRSGTRAQGDPAPRPNSRPRQRATRAKALLAPSRADAASSLAMSCRLSDLITEVRACKTAEAERARITDECAQIRNALREEAGGKRRGRVGATPFRERNMLKLMFAHMMGHSTHWAQMECVKMSASPSFHEKRVGYLGLMLLLDESASVLTLVTHQLSRDLQDESPFVNSLALATLANIASADMARDLHRHVERHLASGPPLTRKKAALTCIRLFKVRPPARACCGRSTPLSPFKEARARALAGLEVAAGRREQAALALGEWGGQCGRRREAATCAHLSAALARCERLRLVPNDFPLPLAAATPRRAPRSLPQSSSTTSSLASWASSPTAPTPPS